MSLNILVTGGAGYIGSHLSLSLINLGHKVTIVDNLSNGLKSNIEGLYKLTNNNFNFDEVDLLEEDKLKKIINRDNISTIFHLASAKSIIESLEKPDFYFKNNIGGFNSLLNSIEGTGVEYLIFSSTAAVYGNPKYLPLDETHSISPINPYAESKAQIEKELQEFCKEKQLNSISLRYFNPLGAHESGLLKEKTQKYPSNLMPYIQKVYYGELDILNIFGDNYDTQDGTGIRDYIHISDLVRGHIAAMSFITLMDKEFEVFNLGLGRGYSVLEVKNTFEKISGVKIPHRYLPRREGDVANVVADCSKAKQEMNWEAEYDLDEMCTSLLRDK